MKLLVITVFPSTSLASEGSVTHCCQSDHSAFHQ